MPCKQSDWDAKHRLAAEAPPSEPASIVRELLPLLPPGPALDIACGTGRHALFLAGRGQHVTAVDFSNVALDILEVRARRMHVPVRRSEILHEAGRPTHRGIELRSEEHTSELQSRQYLVCRLLLEKKNKYVTSIMTQWTLISTIIPHARVAVWI